MDKVKRVTNSQDGMLPTSEASFGDNATRRCSFGEEKSALKYVLVGKVCSAHCSRIAAMRVGGAVQKAVAADTYSFRA